MKLRPTRLTLHRRREMMLSRLVAAARRAYGTPFCRGGLNALASTLERAFVLTTKTRSLDLAEAVLRGAERALDR